MLFNDAVSCLDYVALVVEKRTGSIGGKIPTEENRSTRRKPNPVPLRPLYIPHRMNLD